MSEQTPADFYASLTEMLRTRGDILHAVVDATDVTGSQRETYHLEFWVDAANDLAKEDRDFVGSFPDTAYFVSNGSVTSLISGVGAAATATVAPTCDGASAAVSLLFPCGLSGASESLEQHDATVVVLSTGHYLVAGIDKPYSNRLSFDAESMLPISLESEYFVEDNGSATEVLTTWNFATEFLPQAELPDALFEVPDEGN